MSTHLIQIGSLQRELPIVEVAPGVRIALFVSLGDPEICQEAARLLAPQLPDCDVLLTAETKGIGFTQSLCEALGQTRYIVARKSAKPYMAVSLAVDVRTISTQAKQTLYLDQADQAYLSGKRVILADDVISTGESIKALEALALQAGAEVVGRCAILSEGQSNGRKDLFVLDALPLF